MAESSSITQACWHATAPSTSGIPRPLQTPARGGAASSASGARAADPSLDPRTGGKSKALGAPPHQPEAKRPAPRAGHDAARSDLLSPPPETPGKFHMAARAAAEQEVQPPREGELPRGGLSSSSALAAKRREPAVPHGETPVSPVSPEPRDYSMCVHCGRFMPAIKQPWGVKTCSTCSKAFTADASFVTMVEAERQNRDIDAVTPGRTYEESDHEDEMDYDIEVPDSLATVESSDFNFSLVPAVVLGNPTAI